MNCPGHVLQAAHADALLVLVKVVPALHARHTVLAVRLQPTLRYVPAAHTVQLEGADTPARQKVLAGHAIFVEALGQ